MADLLRKAIMSIPRLELRIPDHGLLENVATGNKVRRMIKQIQTI